MGAEDWKEGTIKEQGEEKEMKKAHRKRNSTCTYVQWFYIEGFSFLVMCTHGIALSHVGWEERGASPCSGQLWNCVMDSLGQEHSPLMSDTAL